MIGLMDKGGMGNAAQTPGSQLASLFQNLPQVPQTQVPQIGAPQYGNALMPSPEQAAAQTRARMLARAPATAAPAAPAKKPRIEYGGGDNR